MRIKVYSRNSLKFDQIGQQIEVIRDFDICRKITRREIHVIKIQRFGTRFTEMSLEEEESKRFKD